MKIPTNTFKHAIANNQVQIGVWAAFANPYAAELMANTGFDWLLLDGEHAPNDPLTVLTQLQAVAPYSTHPVVRTVNDDTDLIKRYMDIGAQTLLIPMVESAEQAKKIVAATRYPPLGNRGVGAGLARASRWNQVENYITDYNQEFCLLIQIESVAGINNIEEICAVEGIDGVFFGPADLSASMGHLGNPNIPEVKDTVAKGIATVKKHGKAAGLLTTDHDVANEYLEHGAVFVAVGVDTTLLMNAAKELSSKFKGKKISNTSSMY